MSEGMKPSRRVTKAHIKSDGQVVIEIQQFNDHTRKWDKVSWPDQTEQPLDSFQAALNELAPVVRKYREETPLPIDKYKVYGVTWHFGTTDVAGAEAPYKVTIAATRALGHNGPAPCNTHRLPVICEDEDAFTVDNEATLAIEEVAKEALRYLDGERKQTEMDLDNEDDEEDDEPLLSGVSEDDESDEEEEEEEEAEAEDPEVLEPA